MRFASSVRTRFFHLWGFMRPGWLNIVGPSVAVLGFYDLILGQVLDKSVGDKMPIFRDIFDNRYGFLPWYVWTILILCIATIVLFENDFRRSHPNSTISLAILMIGYDIEYDTTIAGSTGVAHVERRPDGTLLVEFERRADVETLHARVVSGNKTVELLNREPRRAIIRLTEIPLPEHPVKGHRWPQWPTQVVFECAEI